MQAPEKKAEEAIPPAVLSMFGGGPKVKREETEAEKLENEEARKEKEREKEKKKAEEEEVWQVGPNSPSDC